MYSAGFGQETGTEDRDTERVIEAEEDERLRTEPEEEVVLVPVASAALTRDQKIGLGIGGAVAGITVVGGLIGAIIAKTREAY